MLQRIISTDTNVIELLSSIDFLYFKIICFDFPGAFWAMKQLITVLTIGFKIRYQHLFTVLSHILKPTVCKFTILFFLNFCLPDL